MKNISAEPLDVKLEILHDQKRSGKERPWRPKKVRGLIIADSFKRLGEKKRSRRIKYCGTYLEFTKEVESGRKFLSEANFCRERLCPLCAWRRSLRVFYEVSRVMDEVELQYKDTVPLFLTLTLKNCDFIDLSQILDKIFKGWHKFTNHRRIKSLLVGWFRALELTYNRDTDEFHPHIHAIILVDKTYFEKDYIKTEDWVHLWRVSLGLDYDPICDIRRVKNARGRRKGIAEVAKYTVKDSQIATEDKELTDYLVKILSKALKGRRLYAFGGLLKEIAAFLAIKDPGEGDLVHVRDTIREDVATVIERYYWNFGLANYVRYIKIE